MDLKGKKVLLTGSDGFIGSHLAERLIDEGCDLCAFVYYNSFGSYGWLEDLPAEKLKGVDIFMGDCTKLQELTGYRPEKKLSDGLAETIEWFRVRGLGGYKADIYNV